jgi:hypothetical protein
VDDPNGHYMEDECTYYHEQAITTLRNEEVFENQVEERKEEQTEELHQEKDKEESIEISSTLAPIPKEPRVQERSLLGLLHEQFEDIYIEKLP